jgi:hypothetical protein
MSTIPGFESAQRAWENLLPPDVEDGDCDEGDCDTCEDCLAARAEDEAECLAEAQREEAHLESRYGA